jgi:GIY-YIG catalytic domain.
MNSNGIYRLECKTCNKYYVGQTGRSIKIRQREYVRHIKTKNPLSGYALHILTNRHVYSNSKHTIQLLQECGKER